MFNDKIQIIGIDPGTRLAGYGIVQIQNNRITAVAAGAWRLDKGKAALPERLGRLAVEFREVLEMYKPTHLCVELAFLATNPKTALYLGHARGAILAEAYQHKLIISEMSATKAKKIATGHGHTDKVMVAKVMSAVFGFKLNQLPLDATDALAIAYADATRIRAEYKNSASAQRPILA